MSDPRSGPPPDDSATFVQPTPGSARGVPPGSFAGPRGQPAPRVLRPPGAQPPPDDGSATVLQPPPLAQALGDTTAPGGPPRTAVEPAASGPGGRGSLEAGPGDAIGGFEVERTLGRGGMGIVYLARDPRLERRVALKVLPMTAGTDETAALRFKREAEALAALDHPGIRPVFGWGRDEHARVFWLAMGFVDGRAYDAVVVDEVGAGHESPRRAARVVRDAARALSFAHRRGVIHRDVKPSNIMLEAAPQADGGLKVHVVDFGLARIDGGAELTVEGQVMGTLKFMPPEQALGAEASALSDVYSLGATLFWALTGDGPYEAKRIENLQLKVSRGDEPRRPRALRRDCPADLEAIALRALELEPVRRYATADALADDLERFLAGEPVDARPPGAARRARGWVRERRAVLGPLAALALGLLVAAGWSRRVDPELEGARARLGAIEGELEAASRDRLQADEQAVEELEEDATWRARLSSDDRARVARLHAALLARLAPMLPADRARLEAAIEAWRAAGPGGDGDERSPRTTARGVAQTLLTWKGIEGASELARVASDAVQLASPDGRLLRARGQDVLLRLVVHGATGETALSPTEPVALPAWGVLRAPGARRPATLPGLLLLDPARVLREATLPLPPAVKETDVTRGLLAVAGPGDAPTFLIDPAPASRDAWFLFVHERWSDETLWDAAGLAWRRVRHPIPPTPERGAGPLTVSLHAARAFARARGLRLPTWSELQRAAGGPGWTAPVDPAGLGLGRTDREWTQEGSVWDGSRARPEQLSADERLPFRCAAAVPGQ